MFKLILNVCFNGNKYGILFLYRQLFLLKIRLIFFQNCNGPCYNGLVIKILKNAVLIILL